MMNKASKVPIHKQIADIFRILAFSYREIFIFELLYKALTLFVFIPAISSVFRGFLHLGGFAGATNYELLQFAMSKYGILCMLILIPIATLLIFIEFSVLIILTYYGHKRQRIGLVQAFLQSLSYLPSLFKYGFLGMAIYLLLFLPLGGGLGASLLPSLDIPNFISGELVKTGGGTLLLISVLAIMLFFNIRWTFLLHIVVIEGVAGFRKAARKSAAFLTKRYLRISVVMLSVTLLYLLVVILLIVGIVGAVGLLYALWERQTVFAGVVRIVALKSAVLSLYLATLFSMPLYMATITRLYMVKADPNHAVLQLPELKGWEDRFTLKLGLLHKHKKKIIGLGSITVFAAALALLPAIDEMQMADKKIEIMAHRGYVSKGPENTIEAIQGAIEAKADYAEIDILETKDGDLAVIHDTNLKRLTGTHAQVYDLTMDELRKLEVKQGDFTGRISSLAEVMEMARGKIKLNIEIKTHGMEKNLVDTFTRIVHENDFEKECVVQSLDYEIVQQVKASAPELQVGYIVFAGVPDMGRLHADFVVMEEYMAKESVIASAKQHHKPIYVWTINSTDSMGRFFSMGVDGIITDYPEDAISVEEEIRTGPLSALTRWLNQLSF
ncbi:glycerophosphodiester phosphodiesterase [Paenibacillus radicis (ex Gao et al. 2016)]|uniref:Glycerophosphoryl diester phosphodiesterase n=1 Tax=Paenibacillus radicis (ex Gao et al. 2016) TaxID=1737354 RepID=A0A917LZX0_9BACL|nr:glycerophosphodiester phosphodiesterase [Paenibacillus radicis (ex Gao et al. 2016)]GGG67507.1 glycerophosphoryl diester phosphodiesterase [Paenibacillus radicis (ex Gao et al. 2016)]